MIYTYTKVKENYEHFASGKVLYGAGGMTSFPVRLASEIVQRCFELLRKRGVEEPYSLYDPCCGGGYMLTVIGLLHGPNLSQIIASDIDSERLQLAERNLSLLSQEGLMKRVNQLQELYRIYNKSSHQDAIHSADQLAQLVATVNLQNITCFQADVNDCYRHESKCTHPNIIIADLPYGSLASWKGGSDNPVEGFFESIHRIADPSSSVVAVIADKSQPLRSALFKRLQYERIGKRHFGLFECIR
ncbi:hypothetical protein ACFPYJ_11985 [Paenibacillus solisilvae]|uniref:rRNA methyltransferase n=1 Tax=Paenibacillus solisilvae TaxID=2486751 RepID=A0ABW0VYB5_9BACL